MAHAASGPIETARPIARKTFFMGFPSVACASAEYSFNRLYADFRVNVEWVITCWPTLLRRPMKRASIHTPEHAELVLLLQDLRLKAELSQADVAEALQRPQTYISAVEVGRRGVDLVQVRELCRIYGITFPAFAELFEERISAKESERRPPRRRRRSEGQK